MIAERIKLLVNARIRKLRRPALISALALAVAIALAAVSTRAQQATPDLGPPPPPPAAQPPATPDLGPPAPPADPSKESSSSSSSANAAAEPETPATPAFDPLRAQKSVDVGQFYLKNGNYAAAIDRFKEAIQFQSNMALPWELLGEAYEKDHERELAVAAYQKYLTMMPSGKESDKVRKQLTKLQAEIAHDAAAKPGK